MFKRSTFLIAVLLVCAVAAAPAEAAPWSVEGNFEIVIVLEQTDPPCASRWRVCRNSGGDGGAATDKKVFYKVSGPSGINITTIILRGNCADFTLVKSGTIKIENVDGAETARGTFDRLQ